MMKPSYCNASLKARTLWAFGSMAYEVASGLPPNANTRIDIPRFGSYLKQNCPRLEGDQYSSQLKSLVAFCMVEDPKLRPPIEQIQTHPYIYNTNGEYPTASLCKLVSAYKAWEAQGGSRQSLFSAGGAQGSQNHPSLIPNDEWDFNDDSDFDQSELDNSADAQAVYDAYGLSIDLPQARPLQPNRRRRLPPNMKEFKAPLEKLFDPHTIYNYEDNARAVYTRPEPSDLPLRDDSEHFVYPSDQAQLFPCGEVVLPFQRLRWQLPKIEVTRRHGQWNQNWLCRG